MYLRFKAIKPILEANLIDLPDVDPLYAVKAADETVQLIPRAVFLRLFEEISVDISVRRKAVPAKSSRRVKKYTYVDKDAKPLYKVTVAANPPASPEEAKVRKPSPMAEKCLRILDQHGPLTTPELSGHLYPEVAQRLCRQNFAALSLDLRRKQWVEKKTEAATGLDKWFLTESGREQLQ